MQMTFNIPAALGVAVVTSIIGTVSISRVQDAMTGDDLQQQAVSYSEAVEVGDSAGAASILSALPQQAQDAIQQVVTAAQASTIGLSMVILGVIALLGAVMAAGFLGIRRRPISSG